MSKKDLNNNLIIYTIVSSESQEDNTSLESQRKQGILVAKNNGLTPIVMNEGVASSKYEDFTKREKLMEVYNGIQKGDIKHFFIDYFLSNIIYSYTA